MKIRELRKQLGLSQEELARLVGVKQASISLWESSRGDPTAKNIRKMLKIFNCTSGELFGDDPSKGNNLGNSTETS